LYKRKLHKWDNELNCLTSTVLLSVNKN
jgi:hypothetical protein